MYDVRQGSPGSYLRAQKDFADSDALSQSVSSNASSATAAATAAKKGLDTVKFVPTTGQTVNLTVNKLNVIAPAADLADLTIVYPAASDGDKVEIKITKAVTTLTVNAQAGDTVSNANTAATAGQFITRKYKASDTNWY